MPRIQGSHFNPFGGNDSYLFVDYTVTGQNLPGNKSTISWVLGFHFGSAHIRLDNANCAFGGGPISGDPNGGPYYSGWPAPGGQNTDIFVDSGSFTITHDSSGNRTVTVTGSVSTDFGSSSINTNFALPQIPQSPAAPSNATATRVNDGQINVSWTNNSTGTAPYANVKVYRSVDGGGWALRATLGVVTSYSDTSVSANHKYRYRMSAVGTNGAEVGYGTTGHVWTTPAAPSALVATKLSSGNIRLNWTNNVNYSEYTVRIEESQNGGAFSELTSVSGGVSTFEHVSPNPAVTHTYRIRARTSSGTTLNSAYSANSNTVTLLATANPPTNLAPSGVSRDAEDDIILTWTHNPADGTPQSSYRIQYEVNGGSTVTIGPTASTVSSHTLPGGTLSNGDTITWRVATAGQNGTLSANSSTASFTTRDKPTVEIDTPTSLYNSSQLTVEWTYFQAQASAQAAWQAFLYDDAANLLEQLSGTTEDQTTFSTTVADGASYTVEVVVTSADGLVSDPDSQAFTVVYLPPAAIAVAASYDAGSGAMVLTVTGSPPETGVTEPIATVDLQRRIDDGSWLTFAAGLVLDPVSLATTALDLAPILLGTNTYRAVAYSALPSSVMSAEAAQVLDGGEWAFLSASDADGFATVARLRDSLQVDGAPDRARQLHHFAGREKPVQLTGEATNFALSIGAVLWLDSPASRPEEFEAIGKTKGVVLWRDPTGRRVFGSVSNMHTSRADGLLATVAFTVTELDYTG